MFRFFKDRSPKHDITLDAPDTAYSKSYAIVVSMSTLNDTDWNRVVSYLFQRHSNAILLVYSRNDLKSVYADLRSTMPRYVAFVCQPNECGRIFVAQCHRLMRTLDSDPYIDAMWSIVTGIDGEHAIKSINNDSVAQPFTVHRAICFTNVDENLFETCFTFSDSKEGVWFGKQSNSENNHGIEVYQGYEYLRSSAQIFTEKVNELKPDLLITAGQGTEQFIDMPWSTGKLEVEEYGLVPVDKNSQPVAPFIEESTDPKVFLPIGNCLVGHCTGPKCMVTAFLGRMGVRQMCGYTARSWFGRAGWGTFGHWKSVPGRLSLSDAFFLHQAHMTYDLKSINPELLNFKFDLNQVDPDYETVVDQLDKQYHIDKSHIDDSILNEIYGLNYDRDTFVFYGDPAFIAKLDNNRYGSIVRTKFLRTGRTTHQFIVEYNDIKTAQNFQYPIGSIFTNRIENYNIINGFEYEPILTDNFLLLIKPKPRDRLSTIITIDFRGTIIE